MDRLEEIRERWDDARDGTPGPQRFTLRAYYVEDIPYLFKRIDELTRENEKLRGALQASDHYWEAR
jgi:hypothetical protein